MQKRRRRPSPSPSVPVDAAARSLAGVALAVLAATTAGCSEEATPLDQVTTTVGPTPHQLEPTDQMEELARQQCLDDPELDQGEVNAVDPAQPDRQLATVVVDCDEVRAGSPSGS